MFEYLINGETVTIPRDKLEEVISQNPEAEFIREVEPGNQTPSPEETGVPVKENTTTPNITGSASGDGLLDSTKNQTKIDPPDTDGDTQTSVEEQLTRPSFQQDTRVKDSDKIGYVDPGKVIIGDNVINPLKEVEVLDYAGNFYKNTQKILDLNLPSEKINELFQNTSIPSNYVLGSVNIRAQEDPDFKNDFNNIVGKIGDFDNLSSKDQDEIVGTFYQSLFKTQRNNPFADIVNNRFSEIIDTVRSEVNDSDERRQITENWLKTESGRRLNSLESSYGQRMENLEINTPENIDIANDYMNLQLEKMGFEVKELKKIAPIIAEKSQNRFDELVAEDPFFNTISKKVGPSIYKAIADESNRQNRKDLGLPVNPGPAYRVYESWLGGTATITSGIVASLQKKFKKPLDSYNEQLQQWEGKKDNEIVRAKIYVRNDMGVYRLVGPSRKRTVGEARKLVARRMVDLRKDMLPYLEASKATQKKLQTYMNHPSFVKEINTMEDFFRAPWEATANMAPQVVAAIFTRGASMYFQESGLNYIEQIDNIINDPGEKENYANLTAIRKYLKEEGLEDTMINKRTAASVLFPDKMSTAAATVVGGTNAMLEWIPFFRFMPKATVQKVVGPWLANILGTVGDSMLSAKNLGLYAFTEGLTEAMQARVSNLGLGYAGGAFDDFKKHILTNLKFPLLYASQKGVFDPPTEEEMQEGLHGAKASILPMGFGAVGNMASFLKNTEGLNKEDKKKYIDKQRELLQKSYEDKLISKEEYNTSLDVLNEFNEIEKTLDPKIKGDARVKLAHQIQIKNKIEEEINELDKDQDLSELEDALETVKQEIKDTAKQELSILPESTKAPTKKNKAIAAKNKELMAIIKDPTLKEIIEDPNSTEIEKGIAEEKIQKAKGELYMNNIGMINTAVNKKYDPKAGQRVSKEELFNDANEEFTRLINSFDPSRDIEFGAYAAPLLAVKLNKSITRQTESFKDEETGEWKMPSKQDVTETQIEDTVEDTQTETLNKIATKLKTAFGLEDNTVDKIKSAVAKVFGTSLPAVTDKNFKKKVVEGFKNELTDLIKRDGIFGKDSVEFAAFMEDNAEAIYNALPLDVMTKTFSQFTEKVVDPETGKPIRQRTKEGKNIFRKKDFGKVKGEFINYFTDRSLKSATRSDRKTSIAKQIADQLARDEVVDILSDPKVAEKFKEIQELEGKEVPLDYLERIVRELDRWEDWLTKLQNDGTLRSSLVVPELAILAAKLAIKTMRASLKAGDGLVNAIGLAIKAVQEKYGNAEINPDIEKAIRNNISREKEGIKINQEGLQHIFEDIITGQMPIVMKLGKYTSGKLEGQKVTLTSLFKNKNEVGKSIKVLNDFVKEFTKQNPDINVAELFDLLGQNTFAARTVLSGKASLFNKEKGYNKWFKETFPGYKRAPQGKGKYTPTRQDNIGKNFNFAEDKIRSADALLLYKALAQFVMENAGKRQIAMILSTTTENKNSLLKLVAPVLYYQENLKKGTITTPEHLSPASFINNMMINKYYYKKDIDIDKILSDYAIAIIDAKLAADLKKNGLNANQSSEYNYGENHPIKRIFNDIIKDLGKYDDIVIKNIETEERFGFNEELQKEEQDKLGKDFNEIIEETKGVAADEEISEAQGRNIGRRANRLKIFVPYSAEDLLGLLYRFAGQGKKGDAHLKWIKDNLTTPLTESFIRFETAQAAANEYLKEAKRLAEEAGIDFTKEAIDGYTVDQAIRIHIWSNTGYDLNKLIGMNDDQVARINKHVRQNFDNLEFVGELKKAYFNNENRYPPPKDSTWITGTITTDLLNFTNTITRQEAFQPFYDNVNSIFGNFDKENGRLSGANLNKIKALYGTKFVDALENSLYRIHTGRNRSYSLDKQGNSILNWVNNSIGTIMFFNTRSAVLQTLSHVNFTNWHDNNPFEVAKSWKNQKQFWKDFHRLMFSDYLKSRRSGLKTDVNEQEIATAAASAENKIEAVIAMILKKGFIPTQFADSFAIALGGASFYRNRINSLMKKEGMSRKKAEEQAFKDFREISEETQQSSRPDKISMEQAGFAGRLILAFQNTPMQYNRLAKKAILDLINRRGDTKTNLSKIGWYLIVQNSIFYASQQALFSVLFDEPENDDEEKREKERYFNVANGMADSVLRGSGVYGSVLAVSKNLILEILKEGTDEEDVIKALTALSPPINSKVRKAYGISKKFIYKQELEKMKTMGLDSKNPAILAGADALSFGINLPADRALRKINNLRWALEEETEWWQSVALALGWNPYDLNIDEYGSASNSKNKPKTKGLKKPKIKRKKLKRTKIN